MTAHRATLQTDDHTGRVRQRRLSPRECRDWLSSHDEGRLSYLSGAVLDLWSCCTRWLADRS